MSQQQPSRNLEESNYQQGDVIKADIEGVDGQTRLQRDNIIDHSIVDKNAHNVVADQIGSVGIQLVKQGKQSAGGLLGDLRTDITIGEALEATALTSSRRPIDYSDAAAIQAAEARATGCPDIVPGGIAATAQSAAMHNAQVTDDRKKFTLGEILTDASSKLPSDRPVTQQDADGVIDAELHNDRELCTRHGGVAASMAAAARLNQSLSEDI